MKRNIAIALLTVAMACAIVIGSSVTPPEVVVTASPGTELVDDQMDHAAAAPAETTPVETVPKETISSETEVETTAPVHYCDWGDHIYGIPEIKMVPDCFDLYYKEEMCLVCGFVYRTVWSIYIPEGATSIPAPGGENDLFMYIDYCSIETHIYDATSD